MSENLEELLMKDVFETMFCLHEVSKTVPNLLLFIRHVLGQRAKQLSQTTASLGNQIQF